MEKLLDVVFQFIDKDENVVYNNIYLCELPIYDASQENNIFFFTECEVNKLSFINDSFKNNCMPRHPINFGMSIVTEELEIIRTKLNNKTIKKTLKK